MEEWRDLPGYEGIYKISTSGNIWSSYRTKKLLKQILTHKGYYVVSLYNKGVRRDVEVHRLMASAFLDGFCKSDHIDHINGVRSDNRTDNIRIATRSGNRANAKKQKNCSSRFKGVYWNKARKKWKGSIINNGCTHLGYFVNEADAAMAYDKKAVELFGEFALTNKEMGLL